MDPKQKARPRPKRTPHSAIKLVPTSPRKSKLRLSATQRPEQPTMLRKSKLSSHVTATLDHLWFKKGTPHLHLYPEDQRSRASREPTRSVFLQNLPENWKRLRQLRALSLSRIYRETYLVPPSLAWFIPVLKIGAVAELSWTPKECSRDLARPPESS